MFVLLAALLPGLWWMWIVLPTSSHAVSAQASANAHGVRGEDASFTRGEAYEDGAGAQEAASDPIVSVWDGGAIFDLAEDELMLPQQESDESPRLIAVETLSSDKSRKALEEGASPVLYERGKLRSDGSRRLLTNKVTAQLAEGSDAAAIAAAVGASGFEAPEYAPQHAVFFAETALDAPALADRLSRVQGVIAVETQLARLHSKRALPNDPLISQQWHLKNAFSTRTHLNVEPVWTYGGTGGYRGSGIRIGIVDDGVQTGHPDFADNI